MINLNEETQAILDSAVNDLNLFGKRLRPKMLEVVEKVQKDLPIFKQFETGELLDYLKANKPVKTASVKRTASNKPLVDTLQRGQSHTEIDTSRAGHNGYIICSAQNNTELNMPFFEALKTYAEAKELTLLVSGFSYNKTGFQVDRDEQNQNANYCKSIREYMVSAPTLLYDNLIFAAELDIIPTATRPTNGLNNYHAENSLIIPHAKIELQSLPTALFDDPKFIYSTGCLTVANYRKQRAGQKAEAEHAIAALIVEPHSLASTGWQVRQLHWKDSSFIDLDIEVFADLIQEAEQANCVTFGDLHSEKMDYSSLTNAIELASSLEAKNIVCHDTFDFSSRNHHNVANHLFIAAQGQTSIKDDLKQAASVLSTIGDNLPDMERCYIVRSNHDEALDRFLTERAYDFRNDPINARLYLDLQSEAYRFIENGEKVPDMFKVALDTCELEYPDQCHFLTRQETVKIQDVIISMHGDSGNSGSRGSPNQLSRTYDKLTTGHTHTVSIYSGCYTAGVTGDLDMGYNTAKGGGSSWSHSHIVQYSNGTRAAITI